MLTCPECGEPFSPVSGGRPRKFCSPPCTKRAVKRRNLHTPAGRARKARHRKTWKATDPGRESRRKAKARARARAKQAKTARN